MERSLLRRLLFTAMAAFLGLLGLECGARVASTIQADLATPAVEPDQEWYVHDAALGWRPKPAWSGPVYRGFRAFDDEGFLTQDSVAIDGHDRPTIVFLGDSNTFGNARKTAQTFVERVDTALPGADTINLGVPGYSSFQGAHRFDALAARLKPDVVVASFNWNDRRYVVDAGDIDGAETFTRVTEAAWAAETERALRYSYLAKGLRRVVRGGKAETATEPQAGRLDRLPPRVALDAYRDNLRRIARTAEEQGAAVVFVVLHDNPVQTANLRAGMDHLAAWRVDDAIASFRTAIRLRNDLSDLARLQLARAYKAKRDPDLAKAIVFRTRLFESLHGGYPVETDHAYNNAMRAVAAEVGATVVEGGALLDQTPEVYTDACHFDRHGHERLGALLTETLRPLLAP